MTTLEQELLQLVRDTKTFIEKKHPRKRKERPVVKPLQQQAPTPPKIVEKKPDPQPQEVAPTPKPATPSFSDMRSLVTKHAPQLQIADEAPSDDKAKVASHLYEIFPTNKELAVLCFANGDREQTLMKNLTEAIDKWLVSAAMIEGKILEQKNLWDLFLQGFDVKVILADPIELRKMHQLLFFYKEKPNTRELFLGKIPVIPIRPARFYLENPLEKKTLWNTLCSTLKR